MPKVSGVFDIFENLEKIPFEDIARWLEKPPQQVFLENYLANRINYPQAVPLSISDQLLDLAILREALRRNQIFYKVAQKKIFIPESFLSFTDIKKLTLVFIDAYQPKGLVTFIMSGSKGDEILGSLVSVNCTSQKASLHLKVEDKNFKLKAGSLTILPCLKNRCHISFKGADASIFGKKELLFEVFGGRLGLIVDGRIG